MRFIFFKRNSILILLKWQYQEKKQPIDQPKLAVPDTIDGLLDVLYNHQDHDWAFCKDVVHELSNHKDNRIVPALVPLLEHKIQGLRFDAITALGDTADPQAIPHLIK